MNLVTGSRFSACVPASGGAHCTALCPCAKLGMQAPHKPFASYLQALLPNRQAMGNVPLLLGNIVSVGSWHRKISVRIVEFFSWQQTGALRRFLVDFSSLFSKRPIGCFGGSWGLLCEGYDIEHAPLSYFSSSTWKPMPEKLCFSCGLFAEHSMPYLALGELHPCVSTGQPHRQCIE
jgi:hypothetical protein